MSSERKFWKPKAFQKKTKGFYWFKPSIGVKMSENLSETSHSHEELVVKENSASNPQTSDTNFTSKPEATNNNTVESPDLKSYAKKLGFNFANNEDDLRKFYDFAGPDFIWPSTMTEYDRHDIFYYITDPEWDPVGEEVATNTIAYRRLIESEAFRDKPEGTHVLIVHGKVLNYYEKDVSWEEYEELEKKYPGKYFAPITEKTVLLRRFSANEDTIRKEWQVNICLRSTVNALNEARMASIDNGFRMVIDTGSSMTTIPFFLRKRLQSFREGWKTECITATGYGEGIKLFQASRPWLVCIGNGNNWSTWFRTQEIFSWQRDIPNNIDCGLIGYEVLNNIPHYKPIRSPYIFLNDNSAFNRLQGFE